MSGLELVVAGVVQVLWVAATGAAAASMLRTLGARLGGRVRVVALVECSVALGINMVVVGFGGPPETGLMLGATVATVRLYETYRRVGGEG